MTIEQNTEPQGARGFPTGSFLIRSHHSQSLYHGRRLLQVEVDDHTQTASPLTAWVDESKGELKETERLEDHDNQIFYIDNDGKLHSKASPKDHSLHCRFSPSTMNFELFLQPPQKQPKRCAGRPCQFSYDRVSKVITVSSPLTDDVSDSDSEASLSSPMSERSFPEISQQEFVLELIPREHHCPVARLWNYYVGSEEDKDQRRQDDEKQALPAEDDRVTDGSWHRRRNIRLVPRNDNGDFNPQQATMFQQWDIIPLH
ncbi:hypothetical protein FRC06_002498 [Ceratobasidium sp. 370]|nr:hypothetical protein FRC06_002498 [Ceratobasidium sp. 370]